MNQPRIFAIANQKGGVGKTTTAVNLSTALCAVGNRVLLIDLDPQGNASTGLGLNRQQRTTSIYDVVIGDATLQDAIQPTRVPKLFIVPSSIHLSGAEIELVTMENREHKLQEAFAGLQDSFDYIVIDCPPSLGLLTLNAFVAAQAVLVPLQCEFYALEGLSHLVKTVDRVRNALNPALHVQGIVLTMYDRRNSLSGQVAESVREVMGSLVYDAVIPRNVRISEAPSHGLPAIVYDMNCPGSRAYIKLAKELIRREKESKEGATWQKNVA